MAFNCIRARKDLTIKVKVLKKFGECGFHARDAGRRSGPEIDICLRCKNRGIPVFTKSTRIPFQATFSLRGWNE